MDAASADPDLVCPHGCTEPHDRRYRYPRCTVFPEHRPVPQAGEHCPNGCESEERALARANPGVYFDLADSAMTRCYHCGGSICIACQQTAVDGPLRFCDSCDHPDYDLASEQDDYRAAVPATSDPA